jgi:hypothetical protein
VRRFKFTIRVIASALVTFLVLTTSQVLFAEEKYSFEDSWVSGSFGYAGTKFSYHKHMNAYFNTKIESMLKMNIDDPNYSAPEGDEECSDDNVSVYCVAMGALDRYYSYMSILDEIKGLFTPWAFDFEARFLNDLPLIGHDVTGLGNTSISDLLGLAGMLNDAITRERQSALEAMELTISAYNELRLAYPMHKKYEELLVDLNSYRDMVLDIESRAEWLPKKYIGATSKKGCD